MPEIVDCMPSHARQYFIRLRNEKSEAALARRTRALADLRGESAAKGFLKSGYQQAKEWKLTEKFIGEYAVAYLESAVETCSLYEILIDARLAKCFEDGFRTLISAQYRNTVRQSGNSGGGANAPTHLHAQITGNLTDCRFPIFNSILIRLENARVESGKKAKAEREKTTTMPNTATSNTALPTATVIRILIASPGDVTKERDVVTECIHAWNAAHFAATGVILQPVRWESHTFPASGARPQAIVNEQIGGSGDGLIGIFGMKLGTPTGVALSGTIEEIEIFRNAGKQVSLYFSTAAVPRDADRAQLEALEAYQRERRKDTLYAEFSDSDALHRLVTQHLPGIVNAVKQGKVQKPQSSAPAQSDLVRLFLRTRRGAQSGDVKTVQVSAVIENISDRRKITEYVCTLSVPKACLTHASAAYAGEIKKENEPNRRFFRVSNHDAGRVPMIFQGDTVPLFALDIGVDQLLMKETYLAGDYEGTMADKILAEAVVEGELLRVERSVGDMFENPNQG